MFNTAKPNGALYVSGLRPEMEAFCLAAGIPRARLRALGPGPAGEVRSYLRLRGPLKRAAKAALYSGRYAT